VTEYSFATVNDALNDPSKGLANWCDVLILRPNTKYCRAFSGGNGSKPIMNISNEEVAEELPATYRMQFDYNTAASSPGYFRTGLHADSGPLNTRDYQIVLEAVSLSSSRTFLHLTYAYSYGTVGRLAMKGYLATFGGGKIGFTNIAHSSSAEVKYVGGVRGLVERNTMRYYLTIEAHLGALSSPSDKRLQQRLNNWFNASEEYPRQLHEIDRQLYMQMKQDEYRRQQTIQ
jgi:hypothetical protein